MDIASILAAIGIGFAVFGTFLELTGNLERFVRLSVGILRSTRDILVQLKDELVASWRHWRGDW